jgi:hypothetical protein
VQNTSVWVQRILTLKGLDADCTAISLTHSHMTGSTDVIGARWRVTSPAGNSDTSRSISEMDLPNNNSVLIPTITCNACVR